MSGPLRAIQLMEGRISRPGVNRGLFVGRTSWESCRLDRISNNLLHSDTNSEEVEVMFDNITLTLVGRSPQDHTVRQCVT